MCIAVPGKIISISGYYAAVDIMGVMASVFIGLLEDPKEEDMVLIHAGCAIQRIDQEHFSYLEKVFTVMQEEVH
ncbi:HypC/HybG/HupF family hydrogenase formation chaperone [Lutispora saccharofermentans]|uniref:HypC/HybG/HupF family hydrogenase formation chaperone n=1 Tax=Lutispora saccharofermentans TaxID=3024236 RepID=A0ABT1NEV4_9FIRM|nr:HypC/HybG/HupF family hydrogenase formation chaperone [Lutispora saccharofermentans]MCQ1529599.1 HypC/HybG/HupF family hydrogenase formation chaperone [Lutispora saccharofermentans]